MTASDAESAQTAVGAADRSESEPRIATASEGSKAPERPQKVVTSADWDCMIDPDVVLLNSAQWEEFHELLNSPPRETPRLDKLMTEKSVLE